MSSSPLLVAPLSRRRVCVGLAAVAAIASWRGARAAPSRIGFIGAGGAQESASFLDAVRGDLARRGLVEPASLAIDLRFAEGELELIPKFVGEGTPASALPIEQPTTLELVVNVGVARSLGVAVPRAVPARAGRIIG